MSRKEEPKEVGRYPFSPLGATAHPSRNSGVFSEAKRPPLTDPLVLCRALLLFPFFAGTSRMARSTSHASHVALHLSMRRHALTALCFFCFVSLDRPCLSVSGCCPHLNPSKFEFDEIGNTKNLNIIYIISPSKIQN